MNSPGNKNILVVEDDRSLSNLLSVSMTHEGFNVSVANDGVEALKAVEKLRPDLILLDMMLPQKSGFELIRLLQTPENIKIPIIAVSGDLVADEIREMVLFEPNVHDYLIKPLKVPQLVTKIHSILKTGPHKNIVKSKE